MLVVTPLMMFSDDGDSDERARQLQRCLASSRAHADTPGPVSPPDVGPAVFGAQTKSRSLMRNMKEVKITS